MPMRFKNRLSAVSGVLVVLAVCLLQLAPAMADHKDGHRPGERGGEQRHEPKGKGAQDAEDRQAAGGRRTSGAGKGANTGAAGAGAAQEAPEGDVSAQAVEKVTIDYVAAVPTTYNHLTGLGGEYGERVIGEQVVESLESKDFACGDKVVFFAAFTDTNDATKGPVTLEATFSWTTEASGQPGVGYTDFISASLNVGDSGNLNLEGDETVTVVSEVERPKQEEIAVTIQLTGMGGGDQAIVRLVTELGCTAGQEPTGNLFSRAESARQVDPPCATEGECVIEVGAQTIPMHLRGFANPPPPPPPTTGTVTVHKEASPDTDQRFSFGGDLGPFTLGDDETRVFTDLQPGTYYLAEFPLMGWRLEEIRCSDPSTGVPSRNRGRTVRIRLSAGEEISCVVRNEEEDVGGNITEEPPPTFPPNPPVAPPSTVAAEQVAALPFTGSPLAWFVGIAGLFLALGAALRLREAGSGAR